MGLMITEDATAEVHKLLESGRTGPGQLIRLEMDAEGAVALQLDRQRDGDEVIEYEGAAVMVVEPRVAEALTALSIIAKDTPDGAAIVVRKRPRS